MLYPIKTPDRLGVVKRVRDLMERHGITESEILNAVNNYGLSPWHRANKIYKRPLAFLTNETIKRWQYTAEEQSKNSYDKYLRHKESEKNNKIINTINNF